MMKMLKSLLSLLVSECLTGCNKHPNNRRIENTLWNIYSPSVCLSLSLSQDAFVQLYDRQRDSLFSCSWPSIKTVFGVAALGAASLTIGAYLAQK